MAASEAFRTRLISKNGLGKAALVLVIDEAHCICEWGANDFRPEYRQLPLLASLLPTGTPILAAFATLPPLVLADVQTNLKLDREDSRTYVGVSNAKLNVSLSVRVMQRAVLFPHPSCLPL